MSHQTPMPDPLSRMLALDSDERERLGILHTVPEILGQASRWLEILALIRERRGDLASFMGGATRLLLSGAGSSHFAGLAVEPLLRSRFPVVEALPSTVILSDPDSAFPREPFVLVSFARSGDSPETNEVLRLADRMRPGLVRHLVLTCNAKGELAGLADGHGSQAMRILLPEGCNDQGLAMTSSYTGMVVAASSLAFLDDAEAWEGTVRILAREAGPLLASLATLAERIAREAYGRVFFLGSGPFLGAIMEAQLKVQELSAGRIIAKAEDTLGFRHGFMAAVDARSLIILFLSGDPVRRAYEDDLLAELAEKGLGAERVVVDFGPGSTVVPPRGETRLEVDARGVSDHLLSPLVAMAGQVLGLFCSLALGLKPDSPSPAGVISRVVRGVRIHHRP